jgi:hypothetical protein
MDWWIVKEETNGFTNLNTKIRWVSCSRATITTINTNTKTDFFLNFPPPFLASTSLFLRNIEEDNIFL